MKTRNGAGAPRRKTRPKAKRRKKSRYALIEKGFPGRRVTEFPQMKGRIVEKIVLYSSDDEHGITVAYQDETRVHFQILPGFVLKADYYDQKTNEYRGIKSWGPIPSVGLRLR